MIAGLAGMLASALSMGSGAYLATKTEHEVQEAEIRRESQELELHPEEEEEELALFYQLKGVPVDEAKILAGRLIAQPDSALKTLGSEELGISEQSPGYRFICHSIDGCWRFHPNCAVFLYKRLFSDYFFVCYKHSVSFSYWCSKDSCYRFESLAEWYRNDSHWPGRSLHHLLLGLIFWVNY